MAIGRVFTGCRARLKINGTKVGYATGVSARESTTHEPIKALDNIEVEEHVAVDYEVSATADVVRLVGTTVRSLGWGAKVGSTPAEHLQNILNLGELVMDLEDSQTGELIAVLEGVKLQEQNITVSARAVVGVNVSFVARRMRDESDLSP